MSQPPPSAPPPAAGDPVGPGPLAGEAAAALGDLDAVPVGEHAARYDALHARLSDALARAEEAGPGGAGPGAPAVRARPAPGGPSRAGR